MDVLQGLREVWECEGRRRVVSFRSPLDIWVENPTFLCAEVVFIFWGLLTLRHGMLCSLVPRLIVHAQVPGNETSTTAA